MPRFNKITTRVFADVAESQPGDGAYTKFLSIDKELGLPVSPELQATKNMYAKLVTKRAEDIKTLAALEEIIIQMRAKEVINSELRLSLSRNYIYARSTFFRRGQEMNDIRVVVGQTTDYGDNINVLIKDQDFRSSCREKLIEAMDKEIARNVNNLNYVYANE